MPTVSGKDPCTFCGCTRHQLRVDENKKNAGHYRKCRCGAFTYSFRTKKYNQKDECPPHFRKEYERRLIEKAMIEEALRAA